MTIHNAGKWTRDKKPWNVSIDTFFSSVVFVENLSTYAICGTAYCIPTWRILGKYKKAKQFFVKVRTASLAWLLLSEQQTKTGKYQGCTLPSAALQDNQCSRINKDCIKCEKRKVIYIYMSYVRLTEDILWTIYNSSVSFPKDTSIILQNFPVIWKLTYLQYFSS